MAISLYEGSVLTYLQTLGAVEGFLKRGLEYCREQGIEPQDIVDARVHPDMHPFRYQIHAVAHHSRGAVEALRSGVFKPPSRGPERDYAQLQVLIGETIEHLNALTHEDVNSREGARVMFELGDNRLPFTAEEFVLSFSLPNFHFHATTAYDILRAKGVPVGKRDYLGRLRLDK